MPRIRQKLPFFVTRGEFIALAILVPLVLVGLYVWRAPSNLEECVEQARGERDVCVRRAARARAPMVHYQHATGQGGRVTESARQGQMQVCSERFDLETQACESRFSND